MVAAIKLLHLLEAFSTPWFLFSAPSNHHLVFFLLEIFNNIIQYQFDGNANLVYTIIRKRHVFHSLANLPSDVHGISKCLNSRKVAAVGGQSFERIQNQTTSSSNRDKSSNEGDGSIETPTSVTPKTFQVTEDEGGPNIENKSEIEESMEGSYPAQPAEPGTLKISLPETPAITSMTERESAHPLGAPLCNFGNSNESQKGTPIQDLTNPEEYQLPINEHDEVNASIKRTVTQVRLHLNSILGYFGML